MSELTVSIVRDIQTFESLKSEWNKLHQKSTSDSVFLTWEWLFTWWCTFHEKRTLYIITVRCLDGELKGVGSFCVESGWDGLPLKALTFLGASHVSSEYLDLICDADCESSIGSAIFDVICRDTSSWDCVALTDILETSLAYRTFKLLASNKGYAVKELIAEVCPSLSLAESPELMLSQFKGQLRSTIKRRSKKMVEIGAEIKSLESEDEHLFYIESLFELHQKRWNSVGIKGNFRDKSIRAFHSKVSKLFLSRSILRLYTLNVDEKVIAALYTFEFKGSLFYFQSGYDPEYASLSPGTVLMWAGICDAIDRGLTRFDYLRGAEFYKSLWANESRSTYSLVLIPPGRVKAIVLITMLSFARKLKSRIKQTVLMISSVIK